MSRTARVAPKEYIYHILTRGNNRQNIFKYDKDYKKYLDILQRYKEKYKFKIYHYVLMNNHVHLVLEPTREGGNLSEIMKGINISYAQYYKGKYEHIGHFWQDRYKSIIISKDEYLLACGSYVELNPVRAKIVRDPKDYVWSSYNVYAYGRKDILVDEHLIYKGLSESEVDHKRRYIKFVNEMLHKKDAMKGEMDHRMLYGNQDFKDKIKKIYFIEEMIKPEGRPKKIER